MYQTAIDNFTKAGEMDANQVAVWDSLGEAYSGLASSQTGDERNKSYDQAVEAYKKSLKAIPDQGPTDPWGAARSTEAAKPDASKTAKSKGKTTETRTTATKPQ